MVEPGGPGQNEEAIVYFSRAELVAQGSFGFRNSSQLLPVFYLPLLGPQGARVKTWNLTGGHTDSPSALGHGGDLNLSSWQKGEQGVMRKKIASLGHAGATEWFEEMVYEGKPVQTVQL